jgi:tRNA(Ile)-lysidine synthase TilS/MesJ/rhodanese-related sulfurtransferase
MEIDLTKIQLTYEQVISRWKPGQMTLLDIRDDAAVSYGMIPEAVHIPETELSERVGEIPQNLPVVVYCKMGQVSTPTAVRLRELGFEAYDLIGGYRDWLLSHMESETHSQEDIEKSIRKKFHKPLFSRFAKGINEYHLLSQGDKVAVCISGGKDSMLMAKLFQELQKHNKFEFELVFLVMDPGYSPTNRRVIEKNAAHLGIPITVFETNIFDAVYTVEKSPCYLCARMRRGYLYRKAQELGCNKIALGHHYDDVIETILMGMLYGAQVQTMMPKLHSTHFEGMELIRPMYLIREDDIKHWRDYNDLRFIQCACRFTDDCTTCNPDGVARSKRQEIKQLIAHLKTINPYVEGNIFRSVENVNLSTVIAYKEQGVKHYFWENY